jgi:hypothetical protein
VRKEENKEQEKREKRNKTGKRVEDGRCESW